MLAWRADRERKGTGAIIHEHEEEKMKTSNCNNKTRTSRGDFHDSGSLNLFSCDIFASRRINKKKKNKKGKKVERDKTHTLTSGAGTQRE